MIKGPIINMDDFRIKTTPEDFGMTQDEFDEMKRREAEEERKEAGIERVMLTAYDNQRAEEIAHIRNKNRGRHSYQNHFPENHKNH